MSSKLIMADCSPELSDVLFDLVGWQYLERRERGDSFVNLMWDRENRLPEVFVTQIDEGVGEREALMELVGHSDDCVEVCEIIQEVMIEVPKKRQRTYRKKTSAAKSIQQLVPPLKQIGTISLEERKKKIKRFLEKRKKRLWGKRISYDCRKRVADGRLRVKGRFVTKKAIAEMGVSPESMSPEASPNRPA